MEQNSLTSGLMSDLFWKLNLGNSYELIVWDATNQFLHSYLQGFYFWTSWLQSVQTCCIHPVSAKCIMKDDGVGTEKSRAVSVTTGKPSLPLAPLHCKYLIPQEKNKCIDELWPEVQHGWKFWLTTPQDFIWNCSNQIQEHCNSLYRTRIKKQIILTNISTINTCNYKLVLLLTALPFDKVLMLYDCQTQRKKKTCQLQTVYLCLKKLLLRLHNQYTIYGANSECQ